MHSTHPRRSWHAPALAAGLVLATALTAAPAGARAPSGSGGLPDRSSLTVTPLSADLQITRALGGTAGQQRVEHETNLLYRDSHGRTRTEDGSRVTISDPAAGTTIVLDTATRSYQRISGKGPDTAAARPDGTTASNQQLGSAPRQLGKAVIGGVRVEGSTYTVTVPARKNLPARQREVTTWSSPDIQLPVQTRVVETGYVYEQTYTNIRTGGEPSAALFQVPAGYTEADLTSASRPSPTTRAGTAQANCPIDYLDPVVLFTYYGFPMYSPVPAVTDQNQGCLFIADAAVWEAPLILVPETPLLLPVDVWGAYYLGGYVPWLPWTAFGDVAFAAASTSDATVVDSLVILQIF